MSSQRTYSLAELTYEEAQVLLTKGAIALLPTGATEAHGPHLPLSTDVVISVEGARRAARLLEAEGKTALVLPPIAYAVTEFAASFSGTVSLPIETARALLRDVILGAVRTGFRGVVVCNAHLEPGNLQAIREAVDEAGQRGARAAFPDVTRKPHALRLGEEFKSGACHAGSYETSLVLAADPFLVRSELADELAPNPTSLSVAIRAGKKSFVEAGGERAYFGDPRAASPMEGESLYAELADIFATAARDLY
ncbi:MAG: creatininase family protein [Deltaproteobacteria bacterium]|nr:creatininase family protein [Deltaproteobacteria bacterium]